MGQAVKFAERAWEFFMAALIVTAIFVMFATSL